MVSSLYPGDPRDQRFKRESMIQKAGGHDGLPSFWMFAQTPKRET
jgi:hypothetical protein